MFVRKGSAIAILSPETKKTHIFIQLMIANHIDMNMITTYNIYLQFK